MKLIDKDALVAKIKDLKLKLNWSLEDFSGAKEIAYDNILDAIDGLEVKEVDLDNEITDYINKYYHIRFDETLERGNDPLTTIDFEEIAKHFFELGIQQSNNDNNEEKN